MTNGLGTDGHETVGADAQAATETDGLSTAGHATGGAEAPPVAQSKAVAIAATATTGCVRQPISEELYDAVYNLRQGTPALARMIINKMVEDNADVEELLDDVQLLRETVDDAFSMIMMTPQFRGLRDRTFASGAAEMAAIDAVAAELLDKEYKGQQEPPVAMATFAVAAGGGRGDAASSPPRAGQDTCSRKARKKKRRQRKTTNDAGAAGSK